MLFQGTNIPNNFDVIKPLEQNSKLGISSLYGNHALNCDIIMTSNKYNIQDAVNLVTTTGKFSISNIAFNIMREWGYFYNNRSKYNCNIDLIEISHCKFMKYIEIQDVITKVSIDRLIFKDNYITIDYIYNALVDDKINEFDLRNTVINLTDEINDDVLIFRGTDINVLDIRGTKLNIGKKIYIDNVKFEGGNIDRLVVNNDTDKILIDIIKCIFNNVNNILYR